MRVAEMKAREDFDVLLMETLSQGWTQQYDTPIVVSGTSQGRDTAFRYHPFLGAYYTNRLGARGRRFLRDAIRFTPNRRRLLAQWIATDILGNKAGLRFLSQTGFWVAPPMANIDQWVVIPGNQRIRVFDFSRMKTRVFLKDGFEPATMLREIALRGSGKHGPFQSLDDFCPSGSFLEEPILDGWDLNRIPPWIKRNRLQNQARKTLLRWLERTEEFVERRAYVDDLVVQLQAATEEIRERYGDVIPLAMSWIEALEEFTHVLPDSLRIAQTHGDFQWGNVFYCRGEDSTVLIDWEHSGRRSFYYDLFTEALEARRFTLDSDTFVRRLRSYLKGTRLGSPIDSIGGGKRVGLLAVFLLETLYFFMAESLSGPYKTPPEALLGVVKQWILIGDELQGLKEASL